MNLLAIGLSLLFSFVLSPTAHAVKLSQERKSEMVAEQYFAAFAQADAKTMGSLYEDGKSEIFQDPIFSKLSTDETRAMWAMLLSNPQEYSVSYEIVRTIKGIVIVNWTATYRFSLSGQLVINNGTSYLKVRNGKIAQQIDIFDVCEWFAMALPPEQAGPFCKNPAPFQSGLRQKLSQFMAAVAARSVQ